MKRITVAAAAAFLCIGGAQAQTGSPWYGELGYTMLKIDAHSTSFRPDALRGIVGYGLHPYFSVEGVVAGGIGDDGKSVTVNGVTANADVKLDYLYGIWAKGRYMVGPQFEVFGRLGWTHTKVKSSSANPAASGSESDDDVSYGVGFNYHFSPTAYAGLDWMRYSNQSGTHMDGLTVSIGFRW